MNMKWPHWVRRRIQKLIKRNLSQLMTGRRITYIIYNIMSLSFPCLLLHTWHAKPHWCDDNIKTANTRMSVTLETDYRELLFSRGLLCSITDVIWLLLQTLSWTDVYTNKHNVYLYYHLVGIFNAQQVAGFLHEAATSTYVWDSYKLS